MKKRSNPISLITMIAVIGVIISFLGDSGLSGYFEDLEVSSLEVLLDYINLGLGFLVLAAIFIVLIVRAAKEDKEYFWNFKEIEDQEE